MAFAILENDVINILIRGIVHSSTSFSLLYHRLFGQPSFCVTAVVDAGIVSVLLQIAVGHICPRLTPYHKLFFAVPTLRDRILSAELGAFGMLAGSLVSLLFSFRGRHIHFLSPNFVLILLFPSVILCYLELW